MGRNVEVNGVTPVVAQDYKLKRGAAPATGSSEHRWFKMRSD